MTGMGYIFLLLLFFAQFNAPGLQGRRTRLTLSLGADIEAAYNPFGDLENIETQGWQTGVRYDTTGLETERMLPANVFPAKEYVLDPEDSVFVLSTDKTATRLGINAYI